MRKRLAQLTAPLSRLTPQEQLMAFGGAIAAILLISLIVGLSLSSSLDRKERRIQDKIGKLEQVVELRATYKAREAQAARLEGELRRNKVRLFSYIEDLAKREGLSIGDMNERVNPTEDETIKETTVEARLQKITIDKLVDFLGKLESNNRMVKLKKLEVKTRFDDDTMLDAVVTVATYQSA